MLAVFGTRQTATRLGWFGGCAAVVAAVAGLCAAHSGAVLAEPQPASEYAVKAAYLVNFLMFVERQGPAAPTGVTERVIAVVGSDPFGGSFREVEEGGAGRKVRVVRFPKFDRAAAASLRQCDLVFVSSSEQKRVGAIVESLQGLPVLTVSEADGFLEVGGMIRLVVVGNRVRWEINQAAIAGSGLAASSQLLRNALKVYGAASD